MEYNMPPTPPPEVDEEEAMETEQEQELIEKQNYFENLPPEMIEKILYELSFIQRMKTRLVCKSFKEIIDRRTKVNFVLSDNSLETFTGIEEDRPIETLSVEDLASKLGVISKSRSNLMKNVTHMKLLPTRGYTMLSNGCNYCGSLDCPENTETWKAGTGNSEDNIVTLLRLHPDLRQLTLGPMCFSNIGKSSRLSGIKENLLVRLNIHFGDDLEDVLIHDPSSISAYQQFLKNTFPALQIVIFDNKACAKPVELLLSVYEFVSRHHATLHTVNINSERSYEYTLCTRTVERLVKRLDSMRDRLKLVQLRKLMLRTAAIIPEQLNVLKIFEEDFVIGQTKLEFAVISFVDAEMPRMLGFVAACKETLRFLRVDSSIFKTTNCPFDCTLIKDCKKLTYLDLDIDNREFSWFQNDRSESLIVNVHALPASITELRIEGYLATCKNEIIFRNLRNLKKFVSTGYGRCGRNVGLVKVVLKDSTVQNFILDNDKCLETDDYIKSLKLGDHPGLRISDTWSGYTFVIDRTTFDSSFIV